MAADNERYVDYLDFSASYWKRPDGPPRVWRVIDGRRKTASGEIPRFSIQEVPEELENDVVDFMVRYFIPEEPAWVDTGIGSDPLAVREFRTFWRDIVHHGVSVVALTVDSDPKTKPTIAGVNVLSVHSAEDQDKDEKGAKGPQSKGMKKLFDVYSKLSQDADVLRKYGVDKYLGEAGLSVHPSFRGQGLGEELLRVRDDIGVAYRISVSATIFTATVSQILAARVGFEVLTERKYSELLDPEGRVAFPGVNVEFIKVMGKRLY